MPDKVLIVHVPYQFSGGEEVHVKQLEDAYEKIGLKSITYPTAKNNNKSNFKNSLSSLLPGYSFAILDSLWEKKSFHFIHANNIFPVLGPNFLRWVIKRKIPLVMTVHNHRFFCTNGLAMRDGSICRDCFSSHTAWKSILHNCNKNLLKTLYHSFALTEIHWQKLYHKAVKKFIAPSPYIEQELLRFGFPKENIIQVSHPLPPTPKTRSSENTKSTDVLFAGRLSKEKGIFVALEAAKILPHIHFTFAGTGPEEMAVRALAEISKNITVLGSCSHQEVLYLIQKTKIGILPSTCNEILSLFALEVISQGKYCVVSNSESMQWFSNVRLPVYLAELNNSRSFAGAIERALKAPAISEQELKNIQEKLGEERFCLDLKKMIKDLFPEKNNVI